MTIYIYTLFNNQKIIDAIKNIIVSNKKDNDVQFISNLSSVNIAHDIILTHNVDTQYYLFKHLYSTNIYNMLDDKTAFYQYLNRNTDLLPNLHLIPSYDLSYQGPNIKKQYMVKANNGFLGAYNEIIDDHLHNLLYKYAKTHQIQDLIHIKKILAVNCSCINGTIIGAYTYNTYRSDPRYPYNHQTESNYIENSEVIHFMKELVKRLNYNGFIEVELLIDPSNHIYIMECNPRISGCVYGRIYYKCVMFPYIDALRSKQVVEFPFYNTLKWEG